MADHFVGSASSRLLGCLGWAAFTASATLSCLPASADVVPAVNQSLGSAFSCNGRSCAISGGTSRGSNLFHRFSQFDTRTNVSGPISIVNAPDSRHIIMAILSPAYIDTRLAPANRASLYVMAPQGIALGKGASFSNVNTLLLTTSGRMSLGGDNKLVFDALRTERAQLLDANNGAFAAAPAEDLSLVRQQLREGDADTGNGFFADSDMRSLVDKDHVGISIGSGVMLEVEKSIVIVSNRSPINISSVTEPTLLSANGRQSSADFLSGDGIAIVGQNIAIRGDNGHRPALRSNSQIVVREPTPLLAVADGLLASRDYLDSIDPEEGRVGPQFEGEEFLGTRSQIVIRSSDFLSGSQPADSWRVLLQADGMGCEAGDCGVRLPRVTIDGTTLERIGRTAIYVGDENSPEKYGDYSRQDEFDEAGRGIYAGVDLKDSRVIVGYNYSGLRQDTFERGALPRGLQFEYRVVNGGRIDELSFFTGQPSVEMQASVRLGKTDVSAQFSPQVENSLLFLNNQTYTGGDTAMYWYLETDGNGNNSVRFANAASLTIAPPSSARPQAPAGGTASVAPPAEQRDGARGIAPPAIVQRPDILSAPADSFDQFQVIVDQNVAEDFEATSTSSANRDAPRQSTGDASMLTIQLLPVSAGPASGEPDTGQKDINRERVKE